MDKTLFDSMIRDIYQNRKPDGIKSDFGKVLIIGGSKPYPSPFVSLINSLLYLELVMSH